MKVMRTGDLLITVIKGFFPLSCFIPAGSHRYPGIVSPLCPLLKSKNKHLVTYDPFFA